MNYQVVVRLDKEYDEVVHYLQYCSTFTCRA